MFGESNERYFENSIHYSHKFQQGVPPLRAASGARVNADVGRKMTMDQTISCLVSILVTFSLSGCSTTPDLFLKDDVSGRLYGPLDTSRMTDRHIPEGCYMALYPMRVSSSNTKVFDIECSKSIILRLPGTTNDIPQSEWNSFEKAFLLSPEFQQYDTGSTYWGEENGKEWALRIAETKSNRIVVIRLGNSIPLPPSITPADIETHKVLTKTIINRLEVREASLEDVINAIQKHIPYVQNTPAVIIRLDVSAQNRSIPITMNFRKIRLMDAIHYVAEVSGSSYAISGNTVLIHEGVQQLRD